MKNRVTLSLEVCAVASLLALAFRNADTGGAVWFSIVAAFLAGCLVGSMMAWRVARGHLNKALHKFVSDITALDDADKNK
jgi:uncharacterized membrane protein YfcA